MRFRDYSNYEIYSDGRIWSYKRSNFLKPSTLPNGYKKVTLYDNEGKPKSYYIHRIVYETFSGTQIPEEMQINHISEVKDENFFENLQLVSRKYNCNFGSRNERISKAKTNNPKCSKSVGAYKDGKLVMTFLSTAEAERNGFKRSAVSACCRNCYSREGNNIYKGYEWRYI